MQRPRDTMRLSAGFAIVLSVAASVASAQPGPVENSERIRYGDMDKDHPRHNTGDQADWVQLATPTPASHGTEFIVVSKDIGALAQLRLDVDGKVIVRRVKIIYVDGNQQVVNVDRLLGGKQRSATIALTTPQPIDRVVVTTEPQTKGSYALYGSSVAGIASR